MDKLNEQPTVSNPLEHVVSSELLKTKLMERNND
tara:strand:+ start:32 stop:133 length:102 start_codon:yes stop_codon:yes gene_type:complete